MGFNVFMDTNGDAEGNYTLVALGNESDRAKAGLYPVGTFHLDSQSNLPKLHLIHELRWPRGRPPKAFPKCGFRVRREIAIVRRPSEW